MGLGRRVFGCEEKWRRRKTRRLFFAGDFVAMNLLVVKLHFIVVTFFLEKKEEEEEGRGRGEKVEECEEGGE